MNKSLYMYAYVDIGVVRSRQNKRHETREKRKTEPHDERRREKRKTNKMNETGKTINVWIAPWQLPLQR